MINQSDMVGVWLFFWAMLAVWVLGLFFLQREARGSEPEATAVSGLLAVAPDDPYAGCSTCPTSPPASACCR